MVKKVEVCPKCGNYVEGQIQYSGDEVMVGSATQKGASWVLGAVLGAIIGTIFAPPFGTFIGFVLGRLLALSTIREEAANSVSNELYKDADYLFCCPKCGYSWIRHLLRGIDYTTNEELQNEINTIIAKLTAKRKTANFKIEFCLIAIGLTLWHFFVKDFDFLIFIIWFFGIIGLAVNLRRSTEAYKIIDSLEKISTEDYRGSQIRYQFKRGEL